MQFPFSTQKSIFQSFIFTFLLVPNLAHANIGDNCLTDLSHSLPVDFDWRDSFVLEGEDGTAWQRAIITSPRKEVIVDENLPVKIEGTAEKDSRIAIFLFSPTEQENGSVQAPSMGSCLQATTTDENGYFSLTLDSSFLWRNIDGEIIIDAFYQRTESYDELRQNASGLSFGTFLPPQRYTVTALAHTQENEGVLPGLPPPAPPFGGVAPDLPLASRAVTCDSLCGGRTVLAMRLDPARTTAEIIGGLFDPVGTMPVVIGRLPGRHTYYAGIEDNDSDIDVQVMQTLTRSSLAAEVIKRGLLGIENAGGVSPGLEVISAQSLRAAANELGRGSDHSNQLAFLIKSILTDGAEQNETNQLPPPPPPPPIFGNTPTPTPEASASASPTASDQTPTIPPTPPSLATPTPSQIPVKPIIPRDEAIAQLKSKLEFLNDVDLDGLFPREIPSDQWAEIFVQMLDFWTGGVTINTCLMDDDVFMLENFTELSGMGEQCGLEHSSGVSPLLVLHGKEELVVRPDFYQTKIVYADRAFDRDEAFHFAVGKKTPLYYRYDSVSEFTPDVIGEMCLTRAELPRLIDSIGKKYELFASEVAALARELTEQFPETAAETFVAVELADPADIAERFRWIGDDERLSLVQLYFRLTPEACSKSTLEPPEVSIAATREGFEVGIIE